MYDFCAIKKTYCNEYLMVKDGEDGFIHYTDKDGNVVEKTVFVWTPDRDESLYFDTTVDAEKFAKSYFKEFKAWTIECFNMDYNSLKSVDIPIVSKD